MGTSGDMFRGTALYDRVARHWTLRARSDTPAHGDDTGVVLPGVAASNLPKPHNADWSWRPALWRGPATVPSISGVQNKTMFGGEATVFHDANVCEIALRQIRNQQQDDIAPCGVQLEVCGFEGSFLSVVMDLPNAALQGLKRTHILRINTTMTMEKPVACLAQLNICQGPNTEQIAREFDLRQHNATVELDLFYSDLNEKRIEKAWVDIIFEHPAMNLITLRDLTFLRYRRADI